MSLKQTTYDDINRSFQDLPALVPAVPTALMPYLAGALLGVSFFLAFYFTMIPARGFTVKEPIVAISGSLCAGFGVVALFNAVGVYV
ncbi:hypothetical protein MSPP1_003117 [Malassezia sp. CBS 17886]|nr:hypothetical protein MSPP1_003117 [Malassezia sp. CBS 17886]